MISIKNKSVFICLVLIIASQAFANQTQISSISQTKENVSLSDESNALRAMAGLIENMTAIRNEIEDEKKFLVGASTEELRLKTEKEINDLTSKLEIMGNNFESIATGIDVNSYKSTPQATFDWKQEIQELITPIIQSIKNMSARPREIEKNKNRLDYLRQKETLTNTALKNLDSRINATEDKQLKKTLNEMKKKWEGYLQQITSAQSVLRFQIEEKTREEGSVFKSIQTMIKTFFKTRGKNLLLTASGFLLVFLSMRFLNGTFDILMLKITKNQKNIYFRISSLGYMLMTALASISAALFILYALGDWTLFGLALLFLLSMAWTAKHTIPKHWVEAKMMLNLGTVKENERVIYKGVPWKVSSLGFFTELVNTELAGGRISLPLSKLADMNSRACHPDEPWFPCKNEDWVTLSDGTTGKVILQSPETVQLWLHGGSVKTYHTESFLGLNPQNISKGFLIVIPFGLDYRHQEEIIEIIPQKMREAVLEGIEKAGFSGNLKNLKIEFANAGASSLDLAIIVSFSGAAAESYGNICRLMQQRAVEVCTKNGWSIPFPQLTVHQG